MQILMYLEINDEGDTVGTILSFFIFKKIMLIFPGKNHIKIESKATLRCGW